ncbi:MAG: penicillin-binding transpeptidase domain-containing protein, partial [Patescibacteria group bacterium]
DPKTGQILVMVGSRDWASESRPQGCIAGLNCKFEPKPNVTAYGKGRQPGSAFKPFVYATAFKKGFLPSTAIFDLETEFNASCNPDGTPGPGVKPEECYHPQNYDNVFRGPITFREALAQSINVPSVKVLYLAGLKDSLQAAKNMGITTLTDESRYGLTLVLGGGEVYLLEMVGAYSVFAADGVKNPTVAVLKVEDGQGKIAEEFSPKPEPALEPNIARLINDILSDNKARAPAFGESSFLYFPERPVAVKTGTTNDYRDAWVIGYTPNFALGVWAGNNDNSSMEKKVAGFIAAPLWNAFFKEVFNAGLTKEEFPKPELPDSNTLKPTLKGAWQGGNVYKIDKISGKLATEFTPPDLIEEKVLTQVHSILYWLNKSDPQGPTPPNLEDSQFALWENPIRTWAQNQKISEQTEADIPTESDDVHKPEYQPVVRVLSPQEGTVFKPDGVVKVVTESQGHFPISQIDFFLNDVYLGSAVHPPFDFSFALSETQVFLGEAILKLIIYDQVKNSAALSRPIKIEI